MGKVILSLSMSLDGFVAGAKMSPQLPMGENAEVINLERTSVIETPGATHISYTIK